MKQNGKIVQADQKEVIIEVFGFEGIKDLRYTAPMSEVSASVKKRLRNGETRIQVQFDANQTDFKAGNVVPYN